MEAGTTLYTLWCEWDIGHEGKVFSTAMFAKDAARELFDKAFEDDDEMDFDECWQDLLGTETMRLVK